MTNERSARGRPANDAARTSSPDRIPPLGPTEARVRRAHLGVTGALLAASALAYLVAVWLTHEELPAQMATHFALDGTPDDFMRTGIALAFQGAVVIGVPLMLLLTFGSMGWWRGERARSLSGLLSGLSAGLTAMFVSLLVAHVGVTDPSVVTLGAANALLRLVGVGLVVGLAVTLILPRPLPRGPAVRVSPMPLAAGARASWFGTAAMRQAQLLILVGGVVVVLLAAVFSGVWWLWLVAIGMTLLVIAVSSFQLRIDAGGLAWRGKLGLPRGRIDLASIAGAAVIDVQPGDFGGLGIRALPGRLGLITRSGSALSVTHGGGEFVATVDDAETAAALIEGLKVGRASPPPRGG